jgi:NAD(P)H-hydrate epimerase
LVALCVPASLQPIVAGRVPELITIGLPERAPFETDPDAAAAVVAARPHTALLVGPGLRPGDASERTVERLLGVPAGGGAGVDAPPAVVDAEALNGLARRKRWWTRVRRACVLTPHPGEFGRLDGSPVGPALEERARRAADAARRWGQVIVLKGARTVVASPDGRAAAATFENPALAVGGTGDVLAGVIGSLHAQGMGCWDAACLGVYLHGAAADNVSQRLGVAGLLASDLLGELPRVRRHLSTVRDRAGGSRRLGFAPQGEGEAR